MQNVVGQNISNVHQHAAPHTTTDPAAVRDLLAAFRVQVDQASLENADVLRAMTTRNDTQLADPAEHAEGLRGVAGALPALVVGTAVQQGGEALANAIAGLVS
ncbi:hypothetical protein OG746_37590 [Streptomyces sp. NBC_01016]|uniref:hypothetical protein n=1 Tax=Streptomyces sp. NBC_01016 TaxID=2903720 RepID=UPI002254B198|nr:hypothetical protein [Streptomyces sp. NBC_01016]MCX4834435.1 hypothetical protein [Streptomyces sp. NBC_01016]